MLSADIALRVCRNMQKVLIADRVSFDIEYIRRSHFMVELMALRWADWCV